MESESRSVSSSENGVNFAEERDTHRLLAILPEEVWSLIFEKIEDHEDLEKISNSSPFFRMVLSSKRVLFLFTKVWKVLDFKYHQTDSLPSLDDNSEEIDNSEYKLCQFCKRWRPKWWFSATFAFRLVCRTWCNIVDALLQHIWRLWGWVSACKPELGKTCVLPDGDNTFDINEIEKLDSFVKHFDKTHPSGTARNPFLSKFVLLNLELESEDDDDDLEDERRQHIPNEFSILLSKFGHHIQYAMLCVGPEFSCYTDLRELLELLPNLKMLDIWFGNADHEDDDGDNIENLEAEIRLNPLPTLRNLQLLSIHWAPARIFNELIRSNSHISELKMMNLNENVYGIYDFHTTPIPSLIYFVMQMYSIEQLLRVTDAMKHWPLCKLDMAFGFFMDWSQLFAELEKNLPETVTDLDLTLPYGRRDAVRQRILEECESLKLNLPQITSLKLRFRNVSSLDFLMPMKDSLEHLNISLSYSEEVVKNDVQLQVPAVESGSIVKLLNYSDRLLESNIWTLFPNLKTLGLKRFYPFGVPVGVEQFNTRKEWKRRERSLEERVID